MNGLKKVRSVATVHKFNARRAVRGNARCVLAGHRDTPKKKGLKAFLITFYGRNASENVDLTWNQQFFFCQKYLFGKKIAISK